MGWLEANGTFLNVFILRTIMQKETVMEMSSTGPWGTQHPPFKRRKRKRKRKTSMKSERNSLKFTFDFHVFVTFWELGFLSELAVIDPN